MYQYETDLNWISFICAISFNFQFRWEMVHARTSPGGRKMAECQVCGQSALCGDRGTPQWAGNWAGRTQNSFVLRQRGHLTPFAAEWTLDSPFRHLVKRIFFLAKVGHPSPVSPLAISPPQLHCTLPPLSRRFWVYFGISFYWTFNGMHQ